MSTIARRYLWIGGAFCLTVIALIVGVLRPKHASGAGTGAPPDVMVAPVEQKDVTLYSEWIGTLDGFENAAVKAQVTGYLLRQAYQDGALVHKGQLLFEIDPRPFQAALDQAEGQLAQATAQLANAEAVQVRTRLDVERYTPLAKEQAASQQDLDNATQNNLAAIATVETAKAQIKTAAAAVETAKVNLGFTRLVAPIRLRRATEASRAQLLATEDARQTVILTLVSDVASDYFTLLQLDLELQITRDTVTTQKDSVKLTSFRLDHGVATKLDVLQAQQVLDTANATIPDIERQIGQEEDAISILLGNYPQGVPRGRPLEGQALPPEVPPGVPSSLLERRPDIREAEQTLVAANAEIGVAKAEFFPQISLTGSGGGAFGRSSRFSGLMSSQLGIWSYGAQVSQPIFTGGALRGNLHLVESQHQQALIAYRQAIQQAFGDVSDALIGYQKSHEVRVRQEQTVGDLAESVRLSIMRYRGGTTTYLEVLDGQRSLFDAELALAQARGTEYQNLVQLYRALGGGWQQ